MINTIIGHIVDALLQEFSSGYEVYTETVNQDLNEPCFTIECINPDRSQALKKRYYNDHQFCVHYLSKSKLEWKKECNDAAERMLDCLEVIGNDSDKFRSKGRTINIEDGVVNLTLSYSRFVIKKNQESNMEELKSNIFVKG